MGAPRREGTERSGAPSLKAPTERRCETMKKFTIRQVQKTKEEHLKEIDRAIEKLKYKQWALGVKYEDDLKAIEHEIKLFEEERERESMQKTPDEIKKGLGCLVGEGGLDGNCGGCAYVDNRGPCVDHILPDALALIQQLEIQVCRWISVEEKLPDVDEHIGGNEYSGDLLVYDGARSVVAYYCHTSNEWFENYCENVIVGVTHWMRCPEPTTPDK